jgi:hypothetical protein
MTTSASSNSKSAIPSIRFMSGNPSVELPIGANVQNEVNDTTLNTELFLPFAITPNLFFDPKNKLWKNVLTIEGSKYLSQIFEPRLKQIFNYRVEDPNLPYKKQLQLLIHFASSLFHSEWFTNISEMIRLGHLTKYSNDLIKQMIFQNIADNIREIISIYVHKNKNDILTEGEINHHNHSLPIKSVNNFSLLRPYDIAVLINENNCLQKLVNKNIPPLNLLLLEDIVIGDTNPDHYKRLISEVSDIDQSDETAIVLIAKTCNHMGRLLNMLHKDSQKEMIDAIPFEINAEDNQETIQHRILYSVLHHILEESKKKQHVPSSLNFIDVIEAIENNMFFPDLKAYAYSLEWK